MLYKKMLSAVICLIMCFCMICSVVKVIGILKPFEKYAGRVVGKETTLSEKAKEVFETTEMFEKPMVMICNNRESELELWWAFYYGRNKDIYIISEAETEHFMFFKDYQNSELQIETSKMEYLNAPSECEIVRVGESEDKIFPKTKENEENFATVFSSMDENGIKILADIDNYSDETSRLYELNVFAKKEAEARIIVQMSSDIHTKVQCGTEQIEIGNSTEEVVLNVMLNEGTNCFSFTEDTGNLRILSYRVEVN